MLNDLLNELYMNIVAPHIVQLPACVSTIDKYPLSMVRMRFFASETETFTFFAHIYIYILRLIYGPRQFLTRYSEIMLKRMRSIHSNRHPARAFVPWLTCRSTVMSPVSPRRLRYIFC